MVKYFPTYYTLGTPPLVSLLVISQLRFCKAVIALTSPSFMRILARRLKFWGMNIIEFNARFPDSEACLHDLFLRQSCIMMRCKACNEPFKYYRVKNRKAYVCGSCGHQFYPMAGTIFEGSTTELYKWYYLIYLFSSSKNGVSAKEIERQVKVTYKTAWRMGHQIRKLLADDGLKLKGLVEIDESLYGGKSHGKRGWGAEGRAVLFGMIERNGKVRVKVVPNRQKEVIVPIIKKSVEAKSLVHTDNYKGYYGLGLHSFKHRKKDGKDIHINSMEGYWGNFKKSMAGTHTWVSPKHLQNYLDEFQFRYNYRKKTPKMFDLMLQHIIIRN